MSSSVSLGTQPSPSLANTYLQFCQNELDPALITAFTKESNDFANAALVRAVAFPIIVGSTLLTAAVIAPIFTIVIGFSSVLLLLQVKKVYSTLILKSELAQERVNQLSCLHKHYESLANSTPAEIQQMLKEKGHSFIIGIGQNDAQLSTLKPILARHLFWEEHIAVYQKYQNGKLKLADFLTKENFKLNRKEIYDLQSEALEFKKQMLVAKVKCAFVSAALFNPKAKGNLEDLGTFSVLSGQEMAIATASTVSKSNDLFQFNLPNAPAVTYDQAMQYTIPQLAMLLYRNIPH